MPAVLGLPDVERLELPQGSSGRAVYTVAMSFAATTASRAVSLRSTPKLLRFGDGSPPVAYGQARGRPYRTTVVLAILQPQVELLAVAALP